MREAFCSLPISSAHSPAPTSLLCCSLGLAPAASWTQTSCGYICGLPLNRMQCTHPVDCLNLSPTWTRHHPYTGWALSKELVPGVLSLTFQVTCQPPPGVCCCAEGQGQSTVWLHVGGRVRRAGEGCQSCSQLGDSSPEPGSQSPLALLDSVED